MRESKLSGFSNLETPLSVIVRVEALRFFESSSFFGFFYIPLWKISQTWLASEMLNLKC